MGLGAGLKMGLLVGLATGLREERGLEEMEEGPRPEVRLKAEPPEFICRLLPVLPMGLVLDLERNQRDVTSCAYFT